MKEDLHTVKRGHTVCQPKYPKEVHSMTLSAVQFKCPANHPDEAFYLRPQEKPTEEVWYTRVAIGHNTLSKTVSCLCESGGIKGYFTNHSLRASAATRLFEAGVDEQLIMERTGHSSTTRVRSYKRVTERLHAVISYVLNK